MNKNSTNQITLYILAIIFMSIATKAAYADVGIPTVFVTVPSMIAALIPVIAIEVGIVSSILKRKYISTIKPSSVANAISTLAGLPLSSAFHWLLLWLISELGQTVSQTALSNHDGWGVVLSIVSIGAYLIDQHYISLWQECLGIFLVLFVAFVASIILEYYVYRRMLPEYGSRILVKATIISNLASYVLILIGVFSYVMLY